MITPPSSPVRIIATMEELAEGKLTSKNLERALYALHFDGFVILENVVNHNHLDKLNERMLKDTPYIAGLKESPYNYHKGNIQQDPPPIKDLFFRDIFLNDLAIQITSAFLGARPRMNFLSGNTALKSDESQPVHTDADFEHPQIPFALVLNVPLVTMSPENGSTEFWLGTHTISGLHVQEKFQDEHAGGEIRHENLQDRRTIRPPVQPVVKKGSIIIRDLRLWHCGKPNTEGTPRILLAMIHFAHWYRNKARLEFPEDWKKSKILEHEALEVVWSGLDTEINYLNRGNDYNFDQDDKLSPEEMRRYTLCGRVSEGQ